MSENNQYFEIFSKITTLETEFNHIKSSHDRQVVRIDKVDEKVDNQVLRLEEKMDVQIERVEEKVDSQIERIEEKMDTQSERLEKKIDKIIDTERTLLETINSSDSSLEDKMDEKFQKLQMWMLGSAVTFGVGLLMFILNNISQFIGG